MKPDWKVASLCLVGALLFWLLNALNKDDYTTKLSYPLQIEYDDSLYVPTTALPKQIQANISGNGWDLLWRTLAFGNRPVQYPVTNPLRARYLSTSSLTDLLSEQLKESHVNYVIADTLDLRFERRVVKKVRLIADTSAVRFPAHFVISTAINVIPAVVTVEGPESAMRGYPDTVRIQMPRRINGDFDEVLPIPLPRKKNVKASAEQVTVSFEIAELLSPLP